MTAENEKYVFIEAPNACDSPAVAAAAGSRMLAGGLTL